MAKIEGRFFGSVKHLLIQTETQAERELLAQVLGKDGVRLCEGQVKVDDTWQPYIELKRKVTDRKK